MIFLMNLKTNLMHIYKCVKKDVKHPMDLFTIKSKLENNQYTRLEEFE
jgi:hypothetical protein